MNTAEGGRHTPISSGFRTDMQFGDEHRMVVLEFDKEWLFPGESISAQMTALLHSDEEISRLIDIKVVSLVDGANQIGAVEIVSVLNRDDIVWD